MVRKRPKWIVLRSFEQMKTAWWMKPLTARRSAPPMTPTAPRGILCFFSDWFTFANRIWVICKRMGACTVRPIGLLIALASMIWCREIVLRRLFWANWLIGRQSYQNQAQRNHWKSEKIYSTALIKCPLQFNMWSSCRPVPNWWM